MGHNNDSAEAGLRVEQYIGQRIRDRRDELSMTQEEFGRQVGHWLGKPWSRSTVSVAENGKRAFTAAEIVAIAHVLDTSPSKLFTPPYGVPEVVMPSGATLRAGDVVRNPGILDGYLAILWDDYAKVVADVEQVTKDLRRHGESLETIAGWANPASREDQPEGEK